MEIFPTVKFIVKKFFNFPWGKKRTPVGVFRIKNGHVLGGALLYDLCTKFVVSCYSLFFIFQKQNFQSFTLKPLFGLFLPNIFCVNKSNMILRHSR